MKVNIHKLQKGGFSTFTPIIHNIPQPTQSSNTSSSKDTESVLDDEVFKELMKAGGLSNEVNELVNKLIEIESRSEFSYNDPRSRAASLQIIKEIEVLKNNKEDWENAVKTAKDSGGLGEIAVKDNSLYIKNDKGEVGTISMSEYKKYEGKVQVLTVSELLNERKNNINLVGRNDLFAVANNSIGLEKITSTIQNLVSAISTEKNKEDIVYTRDILESQLEALSGIRPSDEQTKAMQQLKIALSNPSEYFKITNESESKRRYLQSAYDYLWKAIGVNGQQKLTGLAVVNNEKDPKKYIEDLLMSQTTPSSDVSILPVSETGKPKGVGETAANEKNLTQFQMFHKDKLMQSNLTFAVNDPNYSSVFRGTIGGVSPLITPSGNNIGMNTVGNILGLGYNQILKGNQVFYGNKKVGSEDINNIIYDGQDAAKVYMPVGDDGGPDYEANKKFKEIYSVYEANKDEWSIKRAEDHFNEYGYKIKIDTKYEDGNQIKVIRDNQYVKPYLVMYGYTNDATNLIGGNEDWLHKLSSDEEKAILPQLKQTWTIKTGKKEIDLTPNKSFNFEDYYLGMVAIPYRNEASAIVDAMVNQGPRERTASILDVQRNIGYSSNQPMNGDTSSTNLNRN